MYNGHVSILLLFFFSLAITEGPVSVTALIGTNAQFHCAGTGNILGWEVDGQQATKTQPTTTDSGTVQSNITVIATSETVVRCFISESLLSAPVFSNYATLTVLPGE